MDTGLDKAENHEEAGGNRRADRAILITVAAGILTVAGAVWLALVAKAPTTVSVDEAGIRVEGPEADLIGDLRGTYGSRAVSVRGLPSPETVGEFPLARRAICALRDDPRAAWREPSATLRGFLHSIEYDEMCEIFEFE